MDRFERNILLMALGLVGFLFVLSWFDAYHEAELWNRLNPDETMNTQEAWSTKMEFRYVAGTCENNDG